LVTDLPRICPVDGNPLPGDDPRRRYCSPRCRQWVHRVGGLLAAAQLKEEFAAGWERAGPKMNPDAYEIAAECRREAAILRSYGRNP